ncbi:23S rRNA (adenine(2030)-N(6))-methyltransferase RlmJ [Escherichia coli]
MKTDYQAVVADSRRLQTFATGTYALWYPVVLRQQISSVIHDLEATGIRKILKLNWRYCQTAISPWHDRFRHDCD